ncbi:hypothetical protein Pmani_005771 [Petrolisthes manimaculis]|uniref:Uncharacterized protein n=1 Tax=Petrolisthes manimaculis TaxID=1843537 RepID=A0AAE1UGD2_9EUCA|nr:hypothetical protein Pmani_005771 [Petrolisthes manimaculis]
MYRHITSIRMNMVTLRSGLLASKFQGSTSILQPCSQHFAFYWSPLLRTNGILLSFHSKKHLFGMFLLESIHLMCDF